VLALPLSVTTLSKETCWSGPAFAATGPASVVNDDAKALAMAFPAVSRTSATLTANPVPPAKGLLGVNVALAPVTAIVPAADPTENVEVVTDAGMTGSENVTVTLAPAATPVAPWAGTIERTLGGVVSPAPGPLDSP
jgi:hypothetical protein